MTNVAFVALAAGLIIGLGLPWLLASSSVSVLSVLVSVSVSWVPSTSKPLPVNLN